MNLSLKWLNFTSQHGNNASFELNWQEKRKDHRHTYIYTYICMQYNHCLRLDISRYNFSHLCNSIVIDTTCPKLHCLHIALEFQHSKECNRHFAHLYMCVRVDVDGFIRGSCTKLMPSIYTYVIWPNTLLIKLICVRAQLLFTSLSFSSILSHFVWQR